MYEHVMVETLSGTFSAISGGNVYNVMLHVNAATLRGLTSFKACCEENIFTLILSNSHIILHVIYVTHFTIRKSKTCL